MYGFAQLLLAGLAVAVALASWLVARRLRSPPRKTYAWAVSRGVPGDPGELSEPASFEPVEYALAASWRRAPVRAPAWLIDGRDAAAPVVVFTPGWGDGRVGVLPRLGAVIGGASAVVSWDPPGHGESPEPRWFMGVREPALLVELAREVSGGRGVVLMGASAGAGIAVVAAELDARRRGADRVVRGVIAEAPYRMPWTPAFAVLRGAALPWRVNGPVAFAALGVRLGVGPRWRGGGGFDRAARAAGLACPLLVLHGSEDAICPPADGRAIADAAGAGRYEEIVGGAHNDLWSDPEHAREAAGLCAAFLDEVRGPAER